MKWFKNALTYGIFPSTFCGAMLIASWAIDKGLSPGWTLLALTAGVSLIVGIFERVHPYIPSWNKSQKDIGTDSAHALVSIIILPRMLEHILKVLLLSFVITLSDYFNGSLWPHQWPIIGQLALAMIVTQFGEYWVHRTMHKNPFLWRFHATHHSSVRLYWLNAGRFHPFDTCLLFISANLPLMLLGAGTKIQMLFVTWNIVHGLFQHCNINVKLGPLNYIFSMAELHRWHHSVKMEEANSNYGNNIIFWDLVFGTMYYPKDRIASEKIGLGNIEHFPKHYLGQILSPLRWKNIT